jgi:hypothetical protein
MAMNNTFGLDSTPSNSQCIISQRKAFSRNVEIRSCIPMPFGLLLALYLYTLIQTILVQIFLYKHTRLNTRQVFCHAIMYLRTFKPVFHFKRTVPKRIKNVFKFQNFVNIDCMVSTSVVRQKVDLRRTFHFDTRIQPEVRGFINLFSICARSQVRFGTIRAKWKTGFISPRTIPSTTLDFLPTKHDQNSR